MSQTAGAGAEVVHVLTHTHWDREWYLPAGRFRQRLVALIDELLDDRTDRGPFLLDGQAVVIDDYVAVRPERAIELARALQAGDLEAGPWYVLADELIPSGEALVRNLLAGRRALARLGAAPPPVLYSPDAFGHAAALPTIARGFGFPVVVVWRGYGSRRWPAGDTAEWEGPDGSTAILFHLPRSGYELGSNLPSGRDESRARWQELHRELSGRSRTGILLVQNGADHHARQRGHDHAVRALADAAAPLPVERVSLRRFASELVERSAQIALPRVRGELRDSYGYTWTLQQTLASRAHQKRRNAHAERLLIRDVEPWAALAARTAAAARRGLVEAAWREVLLSHPHDTLCGCSIDEVARAMDARLDDATAQAIGARDDALLELIGHDPVMAHARRADWRSLVLVRNRAARTRGGVAEIDIDAFIADVGVGPGSAPPARLRRPGPPRLADGEIPLQLLGTRRVNRRVESPRHYPDNDLVEVRRVVAWVPPIAGYAVASIAAGEGREAPGRRGVGPPAPVAATADRLENGLLRLTIQPDGSVSLAAADDAWVVDRFASVENVGDRGDLYTHAPFGRVHVETRLLRARRSHAGPLRGEIETRWRVPVPGASDRRAAGLPARPPLRGSRFVDVRLRFRLDAGSPWLRVLVDGVNAAPDHRLRVRLRTGIANAQVWADAAFGPVQRQTIVVSDAEAAIERAPATAPLHRYVSLFGGDRGCTVYSDGLAEYEAEREGDVAITLVRAVGELSRNDLPERPGHAGWPVPTPEAQSLGPFAAELAVLPHGLRTDATVDLIERTADDVLVPLEGTTLRSALAPYAVTGGFELDGPGLAFSTAKESEDGRWLVLRCVNLLETSATGAWTLPFDVVEARSARLDETPVETIGAVGRRVPFTAGPRGVVTVLVR